MEENRTTEETRLIPRMDEAAFGQESDSCRHSPRQQSDWQGEDCFAGPSTNVAASATTPRDDDMARSTDDESEKEKERKLSYRVEEEDSPKRPAKRRGRGRPPTTGEYVELAAAKECWLAAERKEKELEEEKDILEMYPRLGSKVLMNEEEKDRMNRMKKSNIDEIAA
ncbi:hypothetical protein DMN91_012447 [Ooceraea biroi]|uniref:Uncharacterized protein n=1 Tax=Ooceraea biroi TaxID=2015173 RepID=A0A3L8D609_OOCBI|nr:hypothetical protein DMN91_012447 [Ooceraea biroi]